MSERPPNMEPLTPRQKNRRDKLRAKRRKVRLRMEAAGEAAELIDKVVAQMAWEAQVEIHGEAEARRRAEHTLRHDEYWSGRTNDSKYRPDHVPAELRGAARATGQTADAVRRGHTVTGWQHAERDGSNQA